MASTRKRLEALTAGLVLPMADGHSRTGSAAPPEAERLLPVAQQRMETRFPPAAGAALPKTGPGQMMAFRGQIQQVEGEMTALREKLSQYEGSLPTRKLDPSDIRPSRWANRHESSFGTSAFAGLKEDISNAGGNVQPIIVRPIAAEAGKYEIVFGHRRHRACLELGIPVLASIWLEELGDAALFAAMDRENRERADLSNYEQGLMYQRALEEQLFTTQRQLAEALGVSHTWVRKALMVAQLPSPIVESFRSPLDINFRHAEKINAEMEKDRRAVLKRAERLRGQGLSSSVVLERLLTGKEQPERAEKIDLVINGRRAGKLVRNATGDVTISIDALAMAESTLDALQQTVGEGLAKIRRS
ncbi:MAG: ParB/RepB/Spo0J family partition protein [Comamonadaceae bacterium]|nr:MAG: ParB/RepB/Spo0J family partition protein [Comamonadaceae bacterium]